MTDTVVVYRVEHPKDGIGPYEDRDERVVRAHESPRHPLFHRDYPQCLCSREESHARFAFPNLDAFYRWFRAPERTRLRAHGFRLVQYKVPAAAVVREPEQVVFLRCKADPVAEEKIPEADL